MIDVSIKRLGPGDLHLLRQMNVLFGNVFDMADEYTATPPSDRYLLRLLSKDTFIAMAALHDDDVIGGIVAYEMEKFEQERSEIYIYDLAVAKPNRRTGVAKKLINQVRHLAGDIGAWVVMIQADNDDEKPIALYSKLGTGEAIKHFDLTPLP